ncbi:MAG: hypothetical protein JNK82_10370 [Myxococcaceae bacterium]|nr:hypothetical protein [Myxococcaceae bacterium]
MRPLFAVLVLFAAIAVAEDEQYRDLSSKEALYISDGPKVAYRGPRGGDPKPLILLSVDGGSQMTVRFKKDPTPWTLTLQPDRSRLVCEAPGQPRQVFERMTKEKLEGLAKGIGLDGGVHTVRIIRPEDGSASYDPTVDFDGKVSPGAKELKVTAFDARGRVRKTFKVDVPEDGKDFYFEASKATKTMWIGTNRYKIEASFDDGAVATTEVTVSLHEYEGEEAKPVIYLYPPAPTEVTVKVEPPRGLTKSEPKYEGGWRVTAHPDGRLFTQDGAQHPYLFWEAGVTEKPAPLRDGFAVPRAELKSFFDRTLALQGLNAREIADFEEYWLPLMAKRPWAAVRFVERAEIDARAPLTISPAPDSVIRVLIDYRSFDTKPVLREQKLQRAHRHGFAAVEWGGLKYR